MGSWFANPLVSLALGALLFADVKFLPPNSAVRSFLDSCSSIQLGQPENRELKVYNDRSASVVIAHVGDDIRVCKATDADELLSRNPLSLHWAAIGLYREDRLQTGWWALTSEQTQYTISLENMVESPLPTQNNREARAAFSDWLQSTHSVPELVAQDLRNANFSSRTPISTGYIHNTMSVLVLIALLLSCQWIPRYTRAVIRARRRSRGRCPHCDYSLQGLSTGSCPECGTPIGSSERAAN